MQKERSLKTFKKKKLEMEENGKKGTRMEKKKSYALGGWIKEHIYFYSFN